VPLVKDQNKLGLLSMKERVESIGGKVVIDAGKDRGCSIRVTIPYSAGQAKDEQSQGDDR
jgi:signal transduction histidine kinase